MIPVRPQPEPSGFDAAVRQKGKAWLKKKGLPATGPLPAGTEVEPYWRACLDDLYAAYGGICAYLSYHFERSSGAGTVEHFVPKSLAAEAIYEWGNYRLATLWVNAKKNAVPDILDPFNIPPDVFRLDLVSGTVYLNPALPPDLKAQAQKTLDVLDLNAPRCKADRAEHFSDYIQRLFTDDYLRKMSPFVHEEARRQGVL